jgi:tetratricopeptide (TPR) repeat protein
MWTTISRWLIKLGLKKGKELIPVLKDSLLGNNPGTVIPFRTDGPKANLLVLVHGFSGNAKDTFTGLPELLMKDSAFNGWHIYSVGYSTDIMPSIGLGIWSAIPDIGKVSQYFNTTLEFEFKEYQRIAIVAHSMGGLVVQKAILEMKKEELDRIQYLILIGTPSNGLRKAALAKWWNRQLRDMSDDGDFIKALRTGWTIKFPINYPFQFKAVAGMNDEFVPVKSSLEPFDKSYQEVIAGNHLSIAKPDSPTHVGFKLILNFISGDAQDNIKGDPEEVNLLLGEYQAVVNKLKEKSDQLDKRGLTNLVFAMEGLGQTNEAMQLLHSHPLTTQLTDLMGILGGRYKRRYLQQSLQEDADKATKYYRDALALSQSKNDQQQIYYHAINLAFMHLVSYDDRITMENFARMALKAIEPFKNNETDVWCMATIGEANLYLGKLDESMKYYEKAAKAAGNDVRAKTSIYTNAYQGYRQWSRSENKNDPYMKFLEEKFL